MKPEELYESLRDMCSRDWLIWTSIEEAKLNGYNIIYFVITTTPTLRESYLVISLSTIDDDVQPLALLIPIDPEVSLDTLNKIVKKTNGMILGSGTGSSIMIPITIDEDIKKLRNLLIDVYSELGIYVENVNIDGYYFDLMI